MIMCDSNIEECLYRLPCGICTYSIPAADVQPVVHGHWDWAEGVFVYGIDRDALGSYQCSACKNCSPHMTNYCPICGADMRDMRGESDG